MLCFKLQHDWLEHLLLLGGTLNADALPVTERPARRVARGSRSLLDARLLDEPRNIPLVKGGNVILGQEVKQSGIRITEHLQVLGSLEQHHDGTGRCRKRRRHHLRRGLLQRERLLSLHVCLAHHLYDL